MNDATLSTVTVSRRPGGYRDRARAYKVMLDGQQVAKIKAGQRHSQPIPPGAHRVKMKIDWTGSQVEEFTVEPGATAEFHCEPNGFFLNLFWQIFTGSKWIRLQRKN